MQFPIGAPLTPTRYLETVFEILSFKCIHFMTFDLSGSCDIIGHVNKVGLRRVMQLVLRWVTSPEYTIWI